MEDIDPDAIDIQNGDGDSKFDENEGEGEGDHKISVDNGELSNGEDGLDDEEYVNRLNEAVETDFSELERSQCIGLGLDNENRNCIYILPRLGLQTLFNATRASEQQMLQQMASLFIKMCNTISYQPYTVVYGHTVFPILTQINLWRQLYKTLPPRYKRNLVTLYMIHPTKRVKLFFKVSKLFIGRRVVEKCRFLHNISELQEIISPIVLRLPPKFLQWEDLVFYQRNVRQTMLTSLKQLYSPDYGAPAFLVKCVTFLKKYGYDREGIFRVPGNDTEYQLALERIRNTENNILIIDKDNTIVASSLVSPRASPQQHRNHHTMPYSTVVLDEVDVIAQVLKAFLRELPEPVITFEAFSRLMTIADSKKNPEGQSPATVLENIKTIVSLMPEEHSRTLDYILCFLADFAHNSSVNKMTVDNLATVFTPTLMRPKIDDPLSALIELKICQKVVFSLLLDKMEGSIKTTLSAGMVDRLARNSRR